MEEYDDLVPTPDENGILELTYRGWSIVDEVVWTMGRELVSLNVSFNSIEHLPPELGDLQMLRELNVSCNRLSEIPKQIGKLRQLQVLRINGNKLKVVPPEVGSCTKLVQVFAGENRLQTFPTTVSNLRELEYLGLSNNDLTHLPAELCLATKLERIDLGNNPGIQHMVPFELQDNSHFIKWICDNFHRHSLEFGVIEASNRSYQGMIDRGDAASKQLEEKVELPLPQP